MKKWILAALIVPWMAGGALAQFAGLPIAGGVEPIPSLRAWVGGGAMLTADFDLYGLRGDLGIVKNFSLFADLGLVDPDFGSTDWAYQGGGWFILPVDMPLDVAVRGAIGEARYDVHGGSVRLHTYNAGVVASKRVGILVPYTFFGLNYARERIRIKESGSFSGNDTDLAVAAGLSLNVIPRLTVYADEGRIVGLPNLARQLSNRRNLAWRGNFF